MSDQPATVQVAIPACPGSPFNLVVAPTNPGVVQVCNAAQHLGPGLAAGLGITVNVTSPGTAQLHVVFKNSDPPSQSDDAYLGLAFNRLGSSYRPFGKQNPSNDRWIAFAPTAMNLTYNNCGLGPAVVALAAGNTFQLACAFDVTTGTLVTSNNGQPFALISGSGAATGLLFENFADTMMEMLPPLSEDDHVGFDYLATEFNKLVEPGPAGDVYRIYAVQPATQIFINAAGPIVGGAVMPCPPSPFALAAGAWCEVIIDGGAHIFEANSQRIRVAQFMRGWLATTTGDSSMMQLVSTTGFLCEHRFFSFTGFSQDANQSGSYVNIVAPTASLGTTLLDGVALQAGGCNGYAPIAFPGTTYSWTICLLPNTVGTFGDEHTASGRDAAGDPVPIMVYVYGQKGDANIMDPNQRAYSYPAGIGMQE